MDNKVVSSNLLSGVFTPLTTTPSGRPCWLTNKLHFVPRLPRSVGIGVDSAREKSDVMLAINFLDFIAACSLTLWFIISSVWTA